MRKEDIESIYTEIENLYPSIHQWLNFMDFSGKSKMVKHSFFRAFVFKNFDINKFCGKYEYYLKSNSNRIPEEPLTLYKEFIFKNYINRKKHLNGNPISKTNLSKIFCHYLCAFDLYDRIISEGDEGIGVNERLNFKNSPIIKKLTKGELSQDDYTSWSGILGGFGEIVWFIPQNKLPSEFQNCVDNGKAAIRIRDLLGLAHLYDDLFVEVRIPKKFVEKDAKVPTICDAVGYPYFRPAKRKDGFGRTIDLKTQKTGIPEGVHSKIPWSNELEVRFVGNLKRKNIEFNEREWRKVISSSEMELVEFQWKIRDEA